MSAGWRTLVSILAYRYQEVVQKLIDHLSKSSNLVKYDQNVPTIELDLYLLEMHIFANRIQIGP